MAIKKKALVIGTGVSKSLSPIIFNYWFKKHNIVGEYGYKEIKEESFDTEIRLLLSEEELCGINITIPFKEKIISYLTKIDKHAAKIKAVNCITKTKKTTYGTNTDWVGFKESLLHFEMNLKTTKIKNNVAIVLGYGGSAKAIIYSLAMRGFETVKVFNRTYEKIINIKQETKYLMPHLNTKIYPLRLEELYKHTPTANLIINTIPKNILNNKGAKKKETIKKNTVGFDVVYQPREGTGFLNNFSSSNKIHGIKMLVYQAAPCFKDWFGVLPVADDNKLFSMLYKNL